MLTADLDFALVFSGLCEIIGSCIRNHVSGVLPNAFESRIAIWGLIPDLPWMTLLSVCRVTPSTSAPSVTDRPKGSRHGVRILRPGWGGFFIGMVFCSLLVACLVPGAPLIAHFAMSWVLRTSEFRRAQSWRSLAHTFPKDAHVWGTQATVPVTCPSVRRARPSLRVRPGLRLRRQLPGVPPFQMQGASSKTCAPPADRRSPPTRAHPTRPHAPQRTRS